MWLRLLQNDGGGEKMTIDEAIKHAEEIAEEKERSAKLHQRPNKNVKGSGKKYNACIECASEHRQLAEWLKELKRDREILNGLSIYFQSLAVDAVINQKPLMFDMRNATKEERESVKQYIVDSAKTTGIKFWDLIKEVNTDE